MLLPRDLAVFISLKVLVTQSCPILSDPVDCSPPGSLHGIFQARILEWIAISFSRWSSWPRDWTQVSCIVGRFFTLWATQIFIVIILNSEVFQTCWPGGSVTWILNKHFLLQNSRSWLLQMHQQNYERVELSQWSSLYNIKYTLVATTQI